MCSIVTIILLQLLCKCHDKFQLFLIPSFHFLTIPVLTSFLRLAGDTERLPGKTSRLADKRFDRIDLNLNFAFVY